MMVFSFLGATTTRKKKVAVGRKWAAGSQSTPVTHNGHKNLEKFIKIYKSRNK